MPIDLKSAVDAFWDARERGDFFPAAYSGKLDLNDAYCIQLAMIDRRVARGERQIG